jgi:dTDP-4-dehydrorhamnose 3,5-epimerase
MNIANLQDSVALDGHAMADEIRLTPLNVINVTGGDVLHAMKSGDEGYFAFGEAYFSIIEAGAVKAWKRHHRMHLNLIVPKGIVKFVLFDDRNKEDKNVFREIILSRENYYRLTVPPMIWFGFQGIHCGESIVLNIADIKHHDDPVDRKNQQDFDYDWGILK